MNASLLLCNMFSERTAEKFCRTEGKLPTFQFEFIVHFSVDTAVRGSSHSRGLTFNV